MSDNQIKAKIQEELVSSMKSGHKENVEILRYIISFITKEEKDHNKLLNESETIQVLKKSIKRNQESLDQFTKAGRTDLANKEKKEIEVIQRYLPEELNEEETRKIVQKSIESCGASSLKDMGKVMSEIKNNYGDKIDMSTVSKQVKVLLGS